MTIPDYDICDCGIIGPHSKCRPTWPESHITLVPDYEDPNKTWYTAWDETQSNILGHFPTKEEAVQALRDWAKTLNPNSDGTPKCTYGKGYRGIHWCEKHQGFTGGLISDPRGGDK